jgi:hypothetical protein
MDRSLQRDSLVGHTGMIADLRVFLRDVPELSSNAQNCASCRRTGIRRRGRSTACSSHTIWGNLCTLRDPRAMQDDVRMPVRRRDQDRGERPRLDRTGLQLEFDEDFAGEALDPCSA